MAVDGDPATAWVVGDQPTRSASASSSTIDEPVDHLTLRQPDGAADRRHIGTVRIDGRRERAGSTSTLDDRSLSAAGPARRHRADRRAEHASTSRSTRSSCPTRRSDRPLAAVGFAEVDVGLGPTVEVVRPAERRPSPSSRDVAGTPVSYVFTRLRTRPTDRWRVDPEPTMRREFDGPRRPHVHARSHGATRPAGRRRGARRAARHRRRRRRRSTVDRRRRRGRMGGRRRRPGHGVDHAVRRAPWGPASTCHWRARSGELTITQPAGDFSPITGLRLTPATTAVDVAVPPAGSTAAAGRRCPNRSPDRS